jgi:hypothetical protein
LRLLNVAIQVAYEDVRQSWTSRRLPENLPMLVHHKSGSLPADLVQKISESSQAEKTKWFHTHPCDADRIRAARELKEAGIFALDGPAMELFSDFSTTSRAVTVHHYQNHIGFEFTDGNLMAADEMIRESNARSETEALIRRFYGSVDPDLLPLLTGTEWDAIENTPMAVAEWQQARQAAERLRADAERISRLCGERQQRAAGFAIAQRLLQAEFKLEQGSFGLADHPMSLPEQRVAAQTAGAAESAALVQGMAQLEPFAGALRNRVTLALRLGSNNPAQAGAVAEPSWARLASAVGAHLATLRDLSVQLQAFALLAQNRGSHSEPEKVDLVVLEIVRDSRLFAQRIQAEFNEVPYPFAHPRGALSIAEYARVEKKAGDEWQQAYEETQAHVERLGTLYRRLVGKVLALADAWETPNVARAPVQRPPVSP